MGYLTRYGRRARTRASLGDALATAVSVSTDPYLSEVICRVGQLKAIEDKTPVGPCSTTPPNLRGGVGLRKAMGPLRAYVYAEQRPWIYPVAAAVIVGLPLLIGYQLGKG